MQDKVIEFTNLLRKSGVRVSVAEAIDAFQSLDELTLDDREVFKDALRASMVKRGDEIPTYNQLFDLFWSGFYDSLQQGFGSLDADMAQMGIDIDHRELGLSNDQVVDMYRLMLTARPSSPRRC